jgi:hypothetical protein
LSEEFTMIDATPVFDSIRAFNKASDGDSGDAEFDAALEMRDSILEYLRSNPERSITLAALVDQFDADEDAGPETEECGDVVDDKTCLERNKPEPCSECTKRQLA